MVGTITKTQHHSSQTERAIPFKYGPTLNHNAYTEQIIMLTDWELHSRLINRLQIPDPQGDLLWDRRHPTEQQVQLAEYVDPLTIQRNEIAPISSTYWGHSLQNLKNGSKLQKIGTYCWCVEKIKTHPTGGDLRVLKYVAECNYMKVRNVSEDTLAVC